MRLADLIESEVRNRVMKKIGICTPEFYEGWVKGEMSSRVKSSLPNSLYLFCPALLVLS